MIWNVFSIAVGAALGANLRYGLSLWAARQWGVAFPYGTLIINVLGSFFIGLLLTLATTKLAVSEPTRLFWVTGLLGGFTTFSTFSYEAMSLANNRMEISLLYVGASVGLGLLAVVAGSALARVYP